MAVAFEGFSIREFASNMRSVDVAKCWPFDGIKAESGEAFLPPIAVRKFRWWSDELELVLKSEAEAEGESSKAPERVSGEAELDLAETAEAVVERQAEKLELRCPVCEVFCAGTVRLMNAHVNRCLTQSSSRTEKEQVRTKAKTKAPKKRSVAEIFAVAPQVERVHDDNDEDDDIDDEGSDGSDAEEEELRRLKFCALADIGFGEKCKHKKEKPMAELKHETARILSVLRRQKKASKLKKKGKRKERDISANDLLIGSIAKKEKSHKLKLHSPVNFTGNVNCSSFIKELEKDNMDTVPIRLKQPRSRYLATEKKVKKVRTSRLIAKKQRPVFSVRGILKNHRRVSGQDLTLCNLQNASKANDCGVLQRNRHVKFSGKDDILGPRKSVPSGECPRLQNTCSLYSEGGANALFGEHFAGRGENLALVEMTGSDENISISPGNKAEVQPMTEKQLSYVPFGIDKLSYLRPHSRCHEHFSDTSATLSQVALCTEKPVLFEPGYRGTSYDPMHACAHRFLSTSAEGCCPNVNTHVGGNILRASDASSDLIHHHRNPTPRGAAMCSVDYVKAFPQPSSSYLASYNGNAYAVPPYSSQSTMDNYAAGFQYLPFRHMTPKELMRSICSVPDWKQRGVTLEEKCRGEDYIGLPLNSHGELINLNSSGKSVFNQLNRPINVTDSFRSSAVYNNKLPDSNGNFLNLRSYDEGAPPDQPLRLLPLKESPLDNPYLPVPSRFSNPELHGSDRPEVAFLNSLGGENRYVHTLESDPHIMNISHRQRRYDQVCNHPGNEKMHPQVYPDRMSLHVTQPTMRLMGKEFTVGSISKDLQKFEDGKLWTDKQIIAEHQPADTTTGISSLTRQFQKDLVIYPASGKERGSVSHSSKIPVNLASQSVLPTTPPEWRFFRPNFIPQTTAVYPRGCDTTNLNPTAETYSYPAPLHSPALSNRKHFFQEPVICGYKSQRVDSQAPLLTSLSTYQNLNLNSNQSKSKQKLPRSTKSAFKFPFLHSDCGERVQPSWSQSSSKSMPPWLLNATCQNSTMMVSSQSYSDAGDSRHRRTMLRPVCRKPEVPRVSNPFPLQSPWRDSVGSAPFPHSKPVQIHHESTSSIIKERCQNRTKFEELSKSRVSSKDPAHGKRTNKKPATDSDSCTVPRKVPTTEHKEDTTYAVTAEMASGNSEGNMQGKAGAVELDLAIDKAVGCGESATQTDGLTNFSGCDYSSPDGTSRSGPIKLAAGAKHVLKPSQDKDQNIARLTHSTISIAAVTSSGRILESQKKSAQIYTL